MYRKSVADRCAANYDLSEKWYEYNEKERKALQQGADSGVQGGSPMAVEA